MVAQNNGSTAWVDYLEQWFLQRLSIFQHYLLVTECFTWNQLSPASQSAGLAASKCWSAFSLLGGECPELPLLPPLIQLFSFFHVVRTFAFPCTFLLVLSYLSRCSSDFPSFINFLWFLLPYPSPSCCIFRLFFCFSSPSSFTFSHILVFFLPFSAPSSWYLPLLSNPHSLRK